jgi:hypothetical protein
MIKAAYLSRLTILYTFAYSPRRNGVLSSSFASLTGQIVTKGRIYLVSCDRARAGSQPGGPGIRSETPVEFWVRNKVCEWPNPVAGVVFAPRRRNGPDPACRSVPTMTTRRAGPLVTSESRNMKLGPGSGTIAAPGPTSSAVVYAL